MNRYTWNYNETDELWLHDIFDTIEDCILDAKENYDVKSDETIAVGVIYPYIPKTDIDILLERLEEDAYEECGEAAESWYISTRKGHEKEFDELQEKVDLLVTEYLEKIGEKPYFYKIDDVRTIKV